MEAPSTASTRAATSADQDRVVRRRRAQEDSDAREESGGRASLLVEPLTDGPRVRLGVLWFFLALAAITAGRWWSAVFMAATAAVASVQTARAWVRAMEPAASPARAAGPGVLAALGSGLITLAAGYGTGTAGAAFLAFALLGGAIASGARRTDSGTPAPAAAIPIAMFLPAFAAVSVVLAVRVDLWAGLFLVLAVSLYDAGSFLLGAEASGRWEGPVAGIMGALAVTFTVATVGFGTFERVEWWLLGMIVAVSCVAGQSVTSALLPSADARVTGLRRLDAYVVAGPALVACSWLMS